jgi:crossover junction endodeoxyribonuclease RuvC
VQVLGIDPGTGTTGYGVVRRSDEAGGRSGPASLVECGVIRTNAGDSLGARLREIYDGVDALIARHRPDVLVVEDIFYSRNVRTTVVLGHVRGVILLAGERGGLTIQEYAPATIKKAVVGRGGATKEQVQFMIMRLLRLQAVPHPSDAADGVAAALAYCLFPPLTDRRALSAIGRTA